MLVAGAAVKKIAAALPQEQEILMLLADMVGDVYVAESALLRAEKLAQQQGEGDTGGIQALMARIYLHAAVDRIYLAGKEALLGFAEGDELRLLLMGLRRFTKVEPFNSKNARRQVARRLIEANKYGF